jgi:LmbE family N-acetylglucosaminyl deacetylase
MAALRRQEQRAAAAQVGVSELTFLGYPDGRVTPSLELRRDLSAVIRRFRPERVITQSPERTWDRLFASHPDHLATGEAAICAVYPDARNPFAHPELLEQGLEPHTVAELWVMSAPGTNVVVDTTEVFERKVAALMSHQSQLSEERDVRKLLTSWSASVAAEAGLPDGRLAEGFRMTHTG